MEEELPPKGILESAALSKYIYDVSVYPREHEQLKELRRETVAKYGKRSAMSIAADEGQFIWLFVKTIQPKRAIEIGVFTGYSLLSTALAMPQHGLITAVDIDREGYDAVALPHIQKAGVAHKVNFVHSPAIPFLTQLLEQRKSEHATEEEEEFEFDFAFVDADKESYREYHELLLKLVKIGGVIAYDNTLVRGSVAKGDDDEMPEQRREHRKWTLPFNSFISTDPRVEICLLSIGDGLTLCRRVQ